MTEFTQQYQKFFDEFEKAYKEYNKYMQNHLTTAERDYLRILGEDIKKLK